MSAIGLDKLPENAAGLRLHKFVREELIACELVMFRDGRPAIDTVLRRAGISGYVEVEPDGPLPDYFADVYTSPNNWEVSVALDRDSYRALKTHWMRCKIDREPNPTERRQG